MPQLIPEAPHSGDAFLPLTPISAYGSVDSGTLQKVRAKICPAAPPADPPDPAADPFCQEVDADMTGTFWEVFNIQNLQLGNTNQLGIWGFFAGSGWSRANPISLTGIDNPTGDPMGGGPPAGHPGGGHPGGGHPGGGHPAGGPPAGQPGGPGRGRRGAQAAAPPAAAPGIAPAAVLAGAGPLPAQFKLRVYRWRLSRLSDAKQLLNGGLLQAAPITLNYDFDESDLTKMVWSTSAATSLPEDAATTTKWTLQLPLINLGAPGAMFAQVYLQQVTGATVKVDFWASFVFNPAIETRFLPHSDIQHELRVTPVP